MAPPKVLFAPAPGQLLFELLVDVHFPGVLLIISSVKISSKQILNQATLCLQLSSLKDCLPAGLPAQVSARAHARASEWVEINGLTPIFPLLAIARERERGGTRMTKSKKSFPVILAEGKTPEAGGERVDLNFWSQLMCLLGPKDGWMDGCSWVDSTIGNRSRLFRSKSKIAFFTKASRATFNPLNRTTERSADRQSTNRPSE